MADTTDFAQAIRFDLLPYINGEGLDLGCGDARPWDWMVGVDSKAGNTGRGPNLIMDARDLSRFSDGAYDFVFSSYLLNEFPREEWGNIVAGWWRVVKPNGYLILFLPLDEKCTAKAVVDVMHPMRPWQFVDARENGGQFFQVYKKSDEPTLLEQPDPERICAVMKLGAHGDALWASSVLPHLKEQGYHVILYTQDTGAEVLKHDPHIDRLIKFESRVPMGELGSLFLWLESKYKNSRILVECVEGTLLPAPNKVQYHFPKEVRHTLNNHNYLDFHHWIAKVPLFPKYQKFYPSNEEKAWANEMRSRMEANVVCFVPNGSSCTKFWPYAGEFVKRLLDAREDATVVTLGDERGCTFEDHPRLARIGTTWNIRQAMTFCQLANVVVGQETGLLNCVGFEKDVHKVVLLTHSTIENLTRDWTNTVTLRGQAECAACHRLFNQGGDIGRIRLRHPLSML